MNYTNFMTNLSDEPRAIMYEFMLQKDEADKIAAVATYQRLDHHEGVLSGETRWFNSNTVMQQIRDIQRQMRVMYTLKNTEVYKKSQKRRRMEKKISAKKREVLRQLPRTKKIRTNENMFARLGQQFTENDRPLYPIYKKAILLWLMISKRVGVPKGVDILICQYIYSK